MKLLQNQLTSVGPLRIEIRCDALSAKEAFHVVRFKPGVLALTLLVQLHLALTFMCLQTVTRVTW
jgi:hypothetical protein